MLPTSLKEALFRMSQLPKREHRKDPDVPVKLWKGDARAAHRLGKLGKRLTQERAPLRLPGTPRNR